MALSKSFKLAELIRHIEYDSSDDVIKTSKRTEDKNKKRGSDTKTATTEFNLDTFAHADFRAARYIVAMSEGTNFTSKDRLSLYQLNTLPKFALSFGPTIFFIFAFFRSKTHSSTPSLVVFVIAIIFLSLIHI